MTPELVREGVGVLVHVLHYAILVGGAVGLLLLLAPGVRPPRPDGGPVDEHARRVAQLRSQLAEGTLLEPRPQLVPAGGAAPWVEYSPGAAAGVDPDADAGAAAEPREQAALALPLAVVSSAAAAGVHAAAGPSHFAEGLLVGSFFVVAALAQLAWAGWALLAVHRRLLVAGVLGNFAVVALWSATRTTGLPGALAGDGLAQPEAVGAWDVAATGWELVVVASCLVLLTRSRADGTAAAEPAGPTTRWHPVARAWLVIAVTVLVLLTISSGGAA